MLEINLFLEHRYKGLFLEERPAYVPSAKTSTGSKAKAIEHKNLEEVIEQVNDLFADENLTADRALTDEVLEKKIVGLIYDLIRQSKSTSHPAQHVR